MNFADAAREAAKFTRTENGAVALNTTSDARLDFYSTIGSLRETSKARIQSLFAESYAQDPLFTMKILFYGRDIREGLGERKTFRVLLNYIAWYYPDALRPNLSLVGEYGRYDDWYALVKTPLEEDMWAAMKERFEEDLRNLDERKPVSLLAKWIKTADSGSDRTRKLGILTAQKLGYSVYDFKRHVRRLRKHINVVERLMCAGEWGKIPYSEVPGRAMMIYRKAFERHDEKRYNAYISRALAGKEKINAGVLYPYDIVEKILYQKEDSMTLEAQWRALPNYVPEGTNALVMADVSGSMDGRPLATSIGLAIYFAQRNTGAYHGLFMTFSEKPEFVALRGDTLRQIISNVNKAYWDNNTDLEAAFKRVLDLAEKQNVAPDEMPKAIVVISDMEIDCCGNKEWSFYDKMEQKFAQAGYVIPDIIFWNVDSRHNVFHADGNRKGVQLVSGQSVSTFKQVMESLQYTPVEAMEKVINSERYACVTVNV